ncbi:MAG: SusF/SusE family outer membrane protein [Fulvivirga sp.]
MKKLQMVHNWLVKGIHLIGFTMCLLLLFSSCENETELDIPISGTPELSMEQENVVLSQKEANSSALNLSWSRGSNKGTGAAIDYVLQITHSDNGFNDPVNVNLGRVVYAYEFNTKNLNDLITEQFALLPGQEVNIAFRIKTIISAASVEPEFSNVAALTVTPYEPVSGTLYLSGDATPNGWDASQATPLTVDPDDPTIFTYSGNLSAGEFKFLTRLGETLPSYNKGSGEGTVVYRDEESQPDIPFVISQAGVYSISVDLVDLTISIEALDEPPFSNIYIVGDASPSGWDIDSPEAFIQNSEDPFIFTYEGVFQEGSFKILAGQTGDWCGEWYRPLVNGQDLALNDVEQNSGCDVDNTWAVTDPGIYKITLDTREVSVSIEAVNLYIVGNAGPNDWNIASPEPMTKNGAVYTYSGALKEGEFKISKFIGDWCGGEWINAATAAQSISNTAYIITHGCDGPDNKWAVTSTEAGNYDITVDLSSGVITITSQ